MTEEQQKIINEFERHSSNASYHFADDSGKEWDLGHEEKDKALKIFNEHPELQDEMRKEFGEQLWSLKHE